MACLGSVFLINACRSQAPTAAPPPKVTVSTPIVREVIEGDEYTGRMESTESVEGAGAGPRLFAVDSFQGWPDGQERRFAFRHHQYGISDSLTVLDAERTMLQAQDQLAQSEAATALVAVYKALGGRWQ